MRISGVYPPIVTPFDDQGRLDSEAFVANITAWNETGLDGYVVAGSNGESVLLEPEEIVELTRLARRAAAPGKMVITGTGCQSTSATIRLSQAAADAGADAVLVMTPSFFEAQMTDEALVRHYAAVADASPAPVLLYNVPKFTHLSISAEAVLRLAKHENIIGIKDSSGNITLLNDLLRLLPRTFDVLMGNAAIYLSALLMGATGGVLALANVAPRECVAIRHLVVNQGRYAEAQEIHFRMAPVARAITTTYGVPGLKAALDMLGYRGGLPRPPLMPVSDSARAAIRQTLIQAGLLAQS